MTTDCNCCQRIVNAEFTRNVDLYRKLHQTFELIGNSKIASATYHMCILGPQICLRRKSVSLKCAGMSLDDPLEMFIIAIDYSDFTLTEQHGFAS